MSSHRSLTYNTHCGRCVSPHPSATHTAIKKRCFCNPEIGRWKQDDQEFNQPVSQRVRAGAGSERKGIDDLSSVPGNRMVEGEYSLLATVF